MAKANKLADAEAVPLKDNEPLYVPEGDAPTKAEIAAVETKRDATPADTQAAYLEEIKRIRAQRGDRGQWGIRGQRLALPHRPGYKRYWFIDKPGRIELAEANGWSHIKDKKNNPLRLVSGSGRDGGAEYSYAMEIPLVFYEEDRARVHQEAAERVAGIKSRPIQAQPGTMKKEDQNKFYSPSEDGVLTIGDTLRQAPPSR